MLGWEEELHCKIQELLKLVAGLKIQGLQFPVDSYWDIAAGISEVEYIYKVGPGLWLTRIYRPNSDWGIATIPNPCWMKLV